ncbi:related to cytidine deaminase [Cephalotrichum gorgonifer]|uniref:Cytidine deaminase n=1 Tax=Cephalotrichum gorgonifer TaxID=2041049 RepID=A0AAE8SR44_9PEZI|nr:related to cytidine deaminase [Cephalotrichum gorgonifer]
MDGIKLYDGSDPAAVASVCETYSISTEEFASLRAKTVAAKATAYCPYSQFRVGAALLAVDESAAGATTWVSGANVENASYPVGTCAERVALGTAVVSGIKKFRALGVATDVSPPSSPCGMCRQFIREFCGTSMPVFMFDRDNNFAVLTVIQLLPMSFGPDSLPSPEELLANRPT